MVCGTQCLFQQSLVFAIHGLRESLEMIDMHYVMITRRHHLSNHKIIQEWLNC